MILLDTTLLSNFAHIGRLDLLRLALSQAATTPHVVAELEKGVASGHLPACDWEWLDVVELTPTEETNLADVRTVLGDGEASCIAVALERKGGVFRMTLMPGAVPDVAESVSPEPSACFLSWWSGDISRWRKLMSVYRR